MPVGKWLISNERTPPLLTFRVTKVLPSKLSMLSSPSVSDFPVKLMFSISSTGLGYTFNCWLLTDKSSCKPTVILEKFRYRKSLRANTPLLLSVLVTVRFPEEKLIFCMLLKVYAVCVPLLSFTYIVCACNPVNPSPNKSTALNFNRLCRIFVLFLLVNTHFIYLFIVNVSMLLLGFLPLNANGYVYETFGISKRIPVKLQLLLIWAETFDNPLTAKCFIYDVSHSISFIISQIRIFVIELTYFYEQILKVCLLLLIRPLCLLKNQLLSLNSNQFLEYQQFF